MTRRRPGPAAVALVVLLLAVTGCRGTYRVDPVVTNPSGTVEPVPGRYAAQVQTGGWVLATDTSKFACGAWTFDGDVNGPYTDAMRDALSANLADVTFMAETMSPEEVVAQGYDAQVIVYQGNAVSDFGTEGSLSGTHYSAFVELTTIVAVVGPDGLAHQETVTGRGEGEGYLLMCDAIADFLSEAASEAVTAVVVDSTAAVRRGLEN